MRINTLLASLVLGAGLIVGSAVPAFAQSAQPAQPAATPVSTSAPAPAAGKWMSIPQIHDKLVADGYRDISKIERERRGYEVDAVNAQGQRVELDVEPIRGDVVRTELD